MISVQSWLERLREWDEAGFYLINRTLRNPFFDLLMPFVTNKWNFVIPVAALLGYILLCRPNRDRLIALSAIAVILLADETSQLLKDLFERTRPFHPSETSRVPFRFHFPRIMPATCLRWRYFSPIITHDQDCSVSPQRPSSDIPGSMSARITRLMCWAERSGGS